jgi:hypothetical protein
MVSETMKTIAEERISTMQVRMLVNVQGGFYNMEAGQDMCSIRRGDLFECEPETALRLILKGEAELKTTGDIGRPYQPANPEQTVELRRKLKIPAEPPPLSRAEQAMRGL